MNVSETFVAIMTIFNILIVRLQSIIFSVLV